MKAQAEWSKALDRFPGWQEWRKAKISKTLWHDDPAPLDADEISNFYFSPELDAQHAAIMAYLELATTYFDLTDCEYYFRRFPFRGLPIPKERHLRHVCEMYFSKFYQFETRLKNCLNLVNKSLPQPSLDVGGAVKKFHKDFKQEIAQRGKVHHEVSFGDIAFDNIFLLGLMSKDAEVTRWWEARHQSAYRRASREWAGRVRLRSKSVEAHLEAVAAAMLEVCPYLK